jgi:hypothetical protein
LTYAEAQGELRQLLSVLEEVQAGLYVVHGKLPAGPEDLGTEDYRVHPVGTSGLRTAIEGLLTDQIEPAMRALRAALEIPEEAAR